MQRSRLDYLAEEVLTQLEFKETKLLSWGFLGGKFDVKNYVQDVLAHPATPLMAELWQELQQQGKTVYDVIANLKERKLLLINNGQGRTRYAETIRLLYLLKQRFNFGDWQSAANLVSNIKMQLKYRRYPIRDQQWQDIEDKLLQQGYQNEFGLQVIETLLEDGSIKLANFQVQSLSHLLESVQKPWDTATIIGAGTGSGKTKSFYLPAFAQICHSIKENSARYVRVLAIYPRVELLKDQLKESLAEANKLNGFLKDQGLRPLSVGTYFGDTPKEAQDVEQSQYYQWEKAEEGYICPYLTCPHCDSGQLVWRYEDHAYELARNAEHVYGEHETLHCTSCGQVIDNQNIILTRKRMERLTPDILFTTTEMLNRKLSSMSDQHIFGVGAVRPPKFVLMDEVHIYNGVSGANVAYVLRRWRNLIRVHNPKYSVHFVGLSATLTNPKVFFSNLTGIQEGNTVYITPADEDLISEGMEYNLVLRGDPISATALLSTSVQAAMLLGRMLDPLNKDVSHGAWGSKIFGFTDKMDVINRWYHIEKDAEDNKLLAQLRDPDKVKDKKLLPKQNAIGQVWYLAKDIDNKSLLNPLKLGITSSQSRGVDPNAKLVIATSTLEVGFNDPDVGAVIQHKAPRDMASFLQRKGRAGRTRGMRPWTVVITSAYGRDRWVYENPEQIFNPVLPELNLPIGNSYIQHIQAAFAVVDWLGLNLTRRGNDASNMWYILSPLSKGKRLEEKRIICELLTQVLTSSYQDLATYIENALSLDPLALKKVMWLPPRSIMFDLIPHLLAHLKTDWNQFVIDGQLQTDNEALDKRTPLAGYVPTTLFLSLDVKDLKLIVPGKEEPETINLRQGMFEFAPGNVSKRYARHDYLKDAHWLPLPEGSLMELTNSAISVTPLSVVDTDQGKIQVFIPYRYQLEQIPKKISDRSTAYLQWKLAIEPNGDGKVLGLPACTNLSNVLKDIEVFASEANKSVLMTRYATEVHAEIKSKKGESERRHLSFIHRGQLVAIGFNSYVDAIAVKYQQPDLRQLMTADNWDAIIAQLRPQYYLQQLKAEPLLKNMLSVFEIEWLWQVVVSSAVAISVSKQEPIADALVDYKSNIGPISERTLKAIFQVTEVVAEQKDDPRLLQRLKEHINNSNLMEVFLDKAEVLYADITQQSEFWVWLDERYVVTVAAAFKDALAELLPDTNTDDLLIDIEPGKIWFSEPDAGGMGIVTSVASAIENNPRQFEEAFNFAVNNCDRNERSKALDVVLANIYQYEMAAVFKGVRETGTLEEQQYQLENLQRYLYNLGLPPKRELVVTLCNKLLHNNSNTDTDSLAAMLHQRWHQEEARINCKIDPRVFAVASMQIDEIKDQVDNLLASVNSGEQIDEKQRFNLVESLLWSDCWHSCPDCLQLYNPYSSFVEPSRTILGLLLVPTTVLLNYTDANWQDSMRAGLRQGNKVRLICRHDSISECQQAILDYLQQPVEVGFELLYPSIESVHGSGTEWFFDVVIKEVLHA